MNFLQNVGSLLISVIFGIFIFMLMIRLIFQVLRADFYNPLSQAIVKITNPPLLPLRRIIPGLWGIDLASVLLILFLQAVEFWLLDVIDGKPFHGLFLLFKSIAMFFNSIIWIFLGAVFIRIILSWVSPYGTAQNPVIALVYTVSEPVLRPARRLLPPIAGLDFSPILAIVGLYILNMAIFALIDTVYKMLL